MVAVALDAGSGADADACNMGTGKPSDASAETDKGAVATTASDGDGMGDTLVDDPLGCSAMGAKEAMVSAERRAATAVPVGISLALLLHIPARVPEAEEVAAPAAEELRERR
jgi:hypothetical protein